MKKLKADTDRLYQDVLFLTSLSPARNYQNLQSLKKAATYIHDHFSALSFDQLEYQPFKISSGQEYFNVSAFWQGKSNERIVIGAHYDVWDNQPGADDNASAVAGLLETARQVHRMKQEKELQHSLEFMAYCLEEPPFFATEEMGSAVHARDLYTRKIPVKLMICYEMIGYFSDAPESQGFPHPSLRGLFPDQGNFIIVGGHSTQPGVAEEFASHMQPNCQVPVYPVASPLTDSLINLSDHRSYWQYGYNALMINDTSFMRNPNYHEKSDTIDTLDFPKMGEVVQGVAGALHRLALRD